MNHQQTTDKSKSRHFCLLYAAQVKLSEVQPVEGTRGRGREGPCKFSWTFSMETKSLVFAGVTAGGTLAGKGMFQLHSQTHGVAMRLVVTHAEFCQDCTPGAVRISLSSWFSCPGRGRAATFLQ